MIAALEGDQAEGNAEDDDGLGKDAVNVEAKPDEQEEEAEQQTLERLDDRLDGAAVFGFGEHQACNEGAEGHRKPR